MTAKKAFVVALKDYTENIRANRVPCQSDRFLDQLDLKKTDGILLSIQHPQTFETVKYLITKGVRQSAIEKGYFFALLDLGRIQNALIFHQEIPERYYGVADLKRLVTALEQSKEREAESRSRAATQTDKREAEKLYSEAEYYTDNIRRLEDHIESFIPKLEKRLKEERIKS